MRIALISDIHANLPALEKVLEDIGRQDCDLVICLGDLVNFAGWDNEVISLIRSRNIPAICGNHDEGIGNNRPHFPFSYSGRAQKEFGLRSIEQVNASITTANRKYLAGLPFSLRFAFNKMSLLMVHGSPRSNLDYMREEVSAKKWTDFLPETPADVLCMGHTHIPYHKILSATDVPWHKQVHLINAGSVGKPKHGNNKACYTTIEIMNTDLEVIFHFVSYPVEEVIRHLHKLGFSDAYDNFLRKR